jgi:hypothetical protein
VAHPEAARAQEPTQDEFAEGVKDLLSIDRLGTE